MSGNACSYQISKDGSRALVAGWEKNGTLTVIDVESRKVVDLHKLEVVKVIETGLGPDPMQMWWPPGKLVEN